MQKSVIEYLNKTASTWPSKIAVQDEKEEITFSQLIVNARKLAYTLQDIVDVREPIGVYIPKGCKSVTSFAAINMSADFYVPLDTKSPLQRVESILTTLEAKVVITDNAHKDILRKFYTGIIIVIEESFDNVIDETFKFRYENYQIDTDPIYSIFTSGSTGTPKGVIVSHRGVIDYIDWAVDTFRINHTSVIGNQAPFYFDNSTLDIYLMYATGATLNVIPEINFAFPSKLIDYLNEHKITFVFWVPFVLINVANMDIFASKKPLYLKDVFFAGEVMPNKHLNYWRKHLPLCRYANLYGPTEITVDCTYYIVDREFSDDEPLPIGNPCKNSDVLILVDRERIAKKDEQGELCVRGTSLALGYYNNPEKTQEAFIQNPLNKHYPEIIYCTGDIVYKNEYNEIMYVGRCDSQIKHNGYRIELGEIETAILGSDLVENCCVLYNNREKQIVLYYQAEQELNIATLRKDLGEKIPKYMLPTVYLRETILKQNSSGKIDRAFYNSQINK